MNGKNAHGHSEWQSRGFPITEDMPFQRRFWHIQRIGWLCMAAVIGMALLGLFSSGPLSSTTVKTANGAIVVEADRFLRVGRAYSWKLTMRGTEPVMLLRIGSSVPENFIIENIHPQPTQATSSPDGLRLTFQSPENGAAITVYLTMQPSRPGLVRTTFTNGEKATAGIAHVVFP